jgi:hypothetical protein
MEVQYSAKHDHEVESKLGRSVPFGRIPRATSFAWSTAETCASET